MTIPLAKFPALDKEAKLLKISVELESAREDTFLGKEIRKNLRLWSIRHMIRYIHEFCKLSEELRSDMEWAIGAKLLKEIEEIEI